LLRTLGKRKYEGVRAALLKGVNVFAVLKRCGREGFGHPDEISPLLRRYNMQEENR
jgi:hypothetical protein